MNGSVKMNHLLTSKEYSKIRDNIIRKKMEIMKRINERFDEL